jgi:hypothetical protein
MNTCSLSVFIRGLRFTLPTYTIIPVHQLTNQKSTPATNNKEREWGSWARNLQHWGLADLVSTFLENGEIFATLAAQGLYVGQPLLEPWMPARAIASLLDDPQQTQEFVKLLREKSQ